MTKEELEDLVKEVINQTPPDRRFSGFRGCLTYGGININSTFTCKDEKCLNCFSLKKYFKEEIEKLKLC